MVYDLTRIVIFLESQEGLKHVSVSCTYLAWSSEPLESQEGLKLQRVASQVGKTAEWMSRISRRVETAMHITVDCATETKPCLESQEGLKPYIKHQRRGIFTIPLL